MNFFRQKPGWRTFLLFMALVVVGASMWYSNRLAADIAVREKGEAELWANAYRNIILAGEDEDVSFEFEVVRENESVPLILTDRDDNILRFRNIDSSKAQNPGYLEKRLAEMRKSKVPIKIEIGPNNINYIYYEDSNFIRRLRFFPFVQLTIISVFLLVAYLLFRTERMSEQNQLWVGMAKETAHQLGTPISSLAAWMEMLKEKPAGDNERFKILEEVQKDIDRLELVADRFSKIGSKPEMKQIALKPHLEKSLDYMRKRSSEQVVFELYSPENVKAKFSPALFEWVIENLLKNALDAMSGKGKISIAVNEEDEKVFIDVKDTGKGIPRSDFKKVFQPGFTTRKRGWGLGLTLSKRIIEQYHHGKIFVKESIIGSGTVFRIMLNK